MSISPSSLVIRSQLETLIVETRPARSMHLPVAGKGILGCAARVKNEEAKESPKPSPYASSSTENTMITRIVRSTIICNFAKPRTAINTTAAIRMSSSSSSTSTSNLPPIPDLKTLQTPIHCLADLCLIPIGTPTASVAREVAQVQRLLDAAGLEYTLHSAGTTISGSWDDVMRVIGQAHSVVHAMGCVRVQSDIRVGSRTDKSQGMQDKVDSVERILGKK